MDVSKPLSSHCHNPIKPIISMSKMLEHSNKTKESVFYDRFVCVRAQSYLSVSESSDGHPRDPAVLQVSMSR